MSVYKVTAMWNQSVMGASETLYTSDVSTTILAKRITRYLAARFLLLPPAVFAVGVRVALYGAKRQSVALLPPYDVLPQTTIEVQIPAHGQYFGKNVTNKPDQFRASLQNRLSYDNTRNVLRYMSGIPDAVSATEPATVDFSGAIDWYTFLSEYYALLVSDGWQIRARAVTGPHAPTSVTGVTSMAASPSLLGMILPAATAPPIVQGSQVALQHFRPPKFTRSATVNGSWTVDSVNATLAPGQLIVYLRNSGLIDPTTVRLTALSTIQLIGYSLFPIQAATWVRVGIHKRGRPSMAPRGRRLARPTLDP
ncbi:MAG: hypothetical protein ACRDQ6_05515 [Pseudonocardiaceae bacterium]